MSFIDNIQTITSVDNLESILRDGLKSRQVAPMYREFGNTDWYIWFDYIGIHKGRICSSMTGIGTSSETGIVFVLDFWKLLMNLADDKLEGLPDIKITNDLIAFTSYPDEVEIWSSSGLFDDNPDLSTRFKSGKKINWIKKHIIDNSADKVCNGTEMVIRYVSEHNFDIKPYLRSIVTTHEKVEHVRHVLDQHKLSHVDVHESIQTPLDEEKSTSLTDICHDLSTTTNPELIDLAKFIGLDQTLNKTEMCLKLYQFINMIGTQGRKIH